VNKVNKLLHNKSKLKETMLKTLNSKKSNKY
jgi:hypothetical protein